VIRRPLVRLAAWLLTTLVALPGVILFWFMIRSGLADLSIGSAGKEGAG